MRESHLTNYFDAFIIEIFFSSRKYLFISTRVNDRQYYILLSLILLNFDSLAGNVRYIWTSGRKCNFAGCERPDLTPANVNGWFWSGSGAKIGPTTQRNSGDWSATGGFGQAQPDNREAPQVRSTSVFHRPLR